jgi:hypothetical protein
MINAPSSFHGSANVHRAKKYIQKKTVHIGVNYKSTLITVISLGTFNRGGILVLPASPIYENYIT